MARLESLPFDIVHIIIAYLGTYDLPAVALVCQLLNAAATPKIYAHVRHTQTLAKQWGKILSPVELLSARSDLRSHLKSLDIRAAPQHKGAPHPQFTRACCHVLANAPGLMSFSWATSGLYDAFLASILRILAPTQSDTASMGRSKGEEKAQDLTTRDARYPPLARLALTEDGLSSSDALILTRLGPVEHIALHKPSRGATRALVEWTSETNPHLTSLAISHNYHLDSSLLQRILENTPNVKSLSITNCLHITPSALFGIVNGLELESLAFSLPRDTDCDSLSATFPSLPTLRHISLIIEPPDEPVPDRHTNAPTDPLTQRLFRHILKAIRNVKLYVLDDAPTDVASDTFAQTIERAYIYPRPNITQTQPIQSRHPSPKRGRCLGTHVRLGAAQCGARWNLGRPGFDHRGAAISTASLYADRHVSHHLSHLFPASDK